MEKLLDAFLGSLAENPLVALVILLVMGILAMGWALKRMFTLYVTVTEKRVEEGLIARDAINANTRVLERVADILKVSIK